MLANISTLSFLLPAVIGIFNYSRLPDDLKLILYIVLFNGMVDTISTTLVIQGINNSILLNLYILIYAFIWSYPFYRSIEEKGFKILIQVSFIITAVLVVYLLSTLDIFTQLNGTSIGFVHAHLILVNLSYLFYIAVRSQKLSFKYHPLFFISSTLLIYHAFTAMAFAPMNQNHSELYSYLWDFKGILYITLNIIISIVFWKYAKIRN